MPVEDGIPIAQPAPVRVRVLQMALVWAFLGEWVGADIGMRSGGLVGSVAGTVAVMVAMGAYGAFLGLLGGRPLDTITGAAFGMVAGMTLAATGRDADLLFRANLGLIAGASEGATLRPYLRTIVRVFSLLSRPLGLLPSRKATVRQDGAWDR